MVTMVQVLHHSSVHGGIQEGATYPNFGEKYYVFCTSQVYNLLQEVREPISTWNSYLQASDGRNRFGPSLVGGGLVGGFPVVLMGMHI